MASIIGNVIECKYYVLSGTLRPSPCVCSVLHCGGVGFAGSKVTDATPEPDAGKAMDAEAQEVGVYGGHVFVQVAHV
jgi:hypothetical protein